MLLRRADKLHRLYLVVTGEGESSGTVLVYGQLHSFLNDIFVANYASLSSVMVLCC